EALETLQNGANEQPAPGSAGPAAPPPGYDNDSLAVFAKPLQDIDQTPLEKLSRLSYVRAAAWIVAFLAEALQHAHGRGILHREVKPSNILMGADGQPMLLDFNLSQRLNSGRAQAAAALGGTVAYMAPEHLRALA